MNPGGWSTVRLGMANTVAKNVAGRNAMVMTARVFIDELSRFAASASLMVAAVSSRAIRLNICVVLLLGR